MKVTIVVPGRWHSFDLAAGLQSLGVLHRIVTSYPRSRTRRWEIADESVVSLPLQLALTTAAWRLGGERLAMRLQFTINNIFAKSAAKHLGQCNVLHAWSGSAEPSLVKARSNGVATILERSSAHMSEQCRILRSEHKKLGIKWVETPRKTVERELREYILADKIAVPSLFVERSFMREGDFSGKLYRNGFGVNLSNFCPGQKPDDVFRVIYAGAMSVRKGIHYLVKAFQSANIPNSELLLVGGGTPHTSALLGKSDPRIKWIGHRPQKELAEHYRSGSVFVMPSIEEGQAMVQFQALACGLPLICTENTGGEDLLSGGQAPSGTFCDAIREYPAGYVVPPCDADAIARCLREISGSSDVYAQKRRAAIDLRANDISWDRYARRSHEFYSNLLRSPS